MLGDNPYAWTGLLLNYSTSNQHCMEVAVHRMVREMVRTRHIHENACAADVIYQLL